MNRRDFLSPSERARHAANVRWDRVRALDLDKLLWIPGEKTIFLPTVDLQRIIPAGYLLTRNGNIFSLANGDMHDVVGVSDGYGGVITRGPAFIRFTNTTGAHDAVGTYGALIRRTW